MAIAIPAGCWVQKDVAKGVDENGNATLRYPIKGGYAALETLMATLTKSTVVVTGFLASTWELQRVAAGGGLLTINCVADAGTEDPDDPTSDPAPLRDIWTIRGARNDVSILAYCGPDGDNPSRAEIECWSKEPDAKLADLYSYRAPDGTVREFERSASVPLAQKIAKGVESVIRFYPVITRTRAYADCPPKCLEKLGFIDAPVPPEPSGPDDDDDAQTQEPKTVVKLPGGLADAIDAHQWLKMQDDAIEQQNGEWQRVESWWGLPYATEDHSDSPWDADLYGDDRWPMPYKHGGEQA